MTGVKEIERLPTGVPGLDLILRGGFPRGGIHILQGPPGTGKTTLANQICYRHARAGQRALYVTLLAESHSRMLVHLGTMRFFDPARLPEQISYVSGIGALAADGLPGLITLLRREIAAHQAAIMILDGLVAAEDSARSDTEFKTFIQELQAQAGLHGCTVFLLTTARGEAVPPEHTMVDGIIELTDVRYESRTERGLFVKKLRGSDYLAGRHAFHISEEGLVVFPRIEAAFRITTRPDQVQNGRLSSGVEGLDAMLGGGLMEASVSGVIGGTGIGKTTLGLHFISQSSAAEPGLFLGFYETPLRLMQQAARLGLDLQGVVDRGHAEIRWQPQGENHQDELAHQLLEAVSSRGVKRLFIDGLGGFMESSVEPSRMSRFLSVLTNELRVRGITTLYTLETRDVIGSGLEMPVGGISSLAEGIIALRFVERHSSARRLLSIVKMRGTNFDPALREFVIVEGKGISFTRSFEGAEELLAGFAREQTARPPSPAAEGR